MQSIEEIKKANELSKILKKHGLVKDNIDSYQKASSMVSDSNNNELINSIKLRLVSLERSKHNQNQEIDSLKKVLEEEEAHIKKLYSLIEELSNRINFLENKLNNLNNSDLSNNNSNNNEKKDVGNDKKDSINSNDKSNTSNNNSIKKNPRMAELSPDLTIEKIFYYGNK